MVVRFNGGHQAGHTVVTSEGKRHIFSNFGSGTLRGIPTYWSKYCTFSPESTSNEYKELKKLDVSPTLIVDQRCPITTHYDILYNRAIEATRGSARHGSCGQGFGATIERHNLKKIKLYAQDLLVPSLLKEKLHNIRLYYKKKINQETQFTFEQFDHDKEDELFHQYVVEIYKLNQEGNIRFLKESEIFSWSHEWESFVFEGAQGILLDEDFGFYPYVTRSNTTSKNAINILNNYSLFNFDIEIFYVTRSYLTRHGAGPFPEDRCISLVNVEEESNNYNKYQGEFKTSCLDIDLLNYSLRCDTKFSSNFKKKLLVTCLDQMPNNFVPIYQNNTLKVIACNDLCGFLEYTFESCLFSYNKCSEHLGNHDFIMT
ncbi:adenylosuccinate synthetase [Larkinella bovis]|uniref:Adenylosuccinate synthetase n=1 Tax=Larkinella bovis TaxID=683041 RepID=A0ABW0IL74_9BACT